MAAPRLDEALEELVGNGVLSVEQAAAVRDALAEPAAPPGGGIHPAAEAAAWVGAVLATAAGVTAAAAFWSQLTQWAQAGLLLLVAVALFGAGLAVLDDERAAARRILAVVWLLAVAALGSAFVLGLNEEPFGRWAVPWVVAGAASTALAVPLWRRYPSTLQLTAVAGSVLATLLAALGLAERPPVEWYGVLVWAVGAALAVLAWGGLARPVQAGRFLGAAVALAGAQQVMVSYPRSGVLLALATVAALFAAAGALDHVALTALAAAALAVFVPQALHAFFPDSLNASATLFLSGVALLAGALATIRRARDHAAPAPAGRQDGSGQPDNEESP